MFVNASQVKRLQKSAISRISRLASAPVIAKNFGIMENVIILGTGCAGLTAAIYTARANLEPLVLEGTQPGGQLTTTSEVENFPGFPEGIDGFEMMDRLRRQAARFGARYQHAQVTRIDVEGVSKKLLLSDGTVLQGRTVIIATGARPRLLGIPGEQEMYGGKGVTTCATCDGAFYRNMDVAVIGGGDSACEEALFLTRFCSKVYLVHRRDALRASKIMADRATSHPKIEMVWNAIPQAIIPDETGNVSALRVSQGSNGESREIPLKGVFIAIGHIPNTDFAADLLPRDPNGYIIPASGQVHTAIPGLYAAGDCVDHVYRQAITAAGMGCQAAIEAERWLAEHGS